MYQTNIITSQIKDKSQLQMKYPKKYTQGSFILLLIEAKKSDISNLRPKYKELILDIRSNFESEILEFSNLKEGSELEFYHKHKVKFERFLNQ